jgi:hypothetical protein
MTDHAAHPGYWYCDPGNPVIAPGQLHGNLDARRAGAAHVVPFGNVYRMVYWGTDRGGSNHILSAQSPVTAPHVWAPTGPLLGAQPERHITRSGRASLFYYR